VYDHYIDFARSLASQETMAELCACLSLQTWFSDAFTVVGYFWPNGERGSGKTHCGTCWAMTSYLGEVVLSSGTFPALRDLADYGAAMLFDDAEILSDPRKSDPQKRELLLAGNRRGAVIPIKEAQPDGTWQTRWLNAYCPRGFTAINLPDPVLASRSIIVPLVRTSDGKRGNTDPADIKRWPCDQAQLQDGLWATALMLLPEAERVWAEMDDEDGIIGREFEPWRGVLTVARLLERHGVDDLEARMRSVMEAYQREKGELMGDDRTVAVVRALVRLAVEGADVSDVLDNADVLSGGVRFTAQDVVNAIKAADEESGETETEWATPKRIGQTLKRLRAGSPDREADRKRTRYRKATKGELLALGRSYGVLAELKPSPSQLNVRNVQDVRNVRNDEQPSCRACDGPLSPAEAATRYQLHYDCTLPVGADEPEDEVSAWTR
jgi:hypothetical protein